MSYVQLKIQNNQAQYDKWTRLGSSIDRLRPKNPARNTTQKIEAHIIQV